MVDFLIVTSRDRACISPETRKGEKWLRDNIIMPPYGAVVFVTKDLLSAFLKELDKVNLTYEER